MLIFPYKSTPRALTFTGTHNVRTYRKPAKKIRVARGNKLEHEDPRQKEVPTGRSEEDREGKLPDY